MDTTYMPLHKILRSFLCRNRLVGKKLLSATSAVLPRSVSTKLRFAAEQIAFRIVPEYQGETLPAIFHYWSNRFVRPVLEKIGYQSPEEMYYIETRKVALVMDKPVSILSLGSGGCSLELALGARLKADGIPAQIECVDFNAELIKQAQARAQGAGLAKMFRFSSQDCNCGITTSSKDVIIVNQFFHHIDNLEKVCANLEELMTSSGVLLTSDIIGRNGHVLWPTIDKRVQDYWTFLSAEKRLDRYFARVQPRYVSIDHSAYSNEGVRAQDIVRCLSNHFDFEVFVTFGGAIIPFVERRLGFNFDPESPADNVFIEKVAEEDHRAIYNGDYPASNMLAVLKHRGGTLGQHFVPVSPAEHIAMTEFQKQLI